MYRKFAVAIMTLVSFGAFAGVKVTSLDLQTQGKNGLFKITLDGRSNDLPDLKVLGNTIEITLGNSSAFPAITKSIRGANLSANNLAGKAMVKATLPYAIDASQVDIGFKGSNIEVYFPRGTVTATVQKVSAPTANKAAEVLAPAPKKKEASVKKEDLNEDYLSKLMNEEKKEAAPAVVKDEVKVAAAAPERAEVKAASSDAFPLVGYAAKFTVFLALVLGLFYGAVQFLKKGVFNKGKLGFLNNSKMIEVLSTTYIAPKKSLMIVKAHKQLFLVANSENGIQFLSEMKDTSGIIKEGEKEITGTNFDINMLNAEVNSDAAAVILKENIHESTPVKDETPLAKIAKATDVVKFSEELKKKAKKLKPIEFN